MNFRKLKRDPEHIRKIIDKRDDGSVWVKEDLDIYVLTKFENYILLTITSDKVNVFGNFILINDGKFAILNVAGLVDLEPTTSENVKIGTESYYKFSYKAGTKFIINRNVLLSGQMSYYILERYLFRGGCPSYLDALDRVNIFTTFTRFNGVEVDKRVEVLDIIVAQSLRDIKDINTEFRHSGASDKDVQSVALANVVHGKVSVINKISGSFQKAGLISALNTDIKILSPVEKILRA